MRTYLETLKANVFRQTQFAAFEIHMHRTVEQGQPVTGAALSDVHLQMTRAACGHNRLLGG